MSQERCESFARQLGAMLQYVVKLRGEIDQAQAYVAVARKGDKFEQEMELQKHLTEMHGSLGSAEQAAYEFSGRSSIQKAHELYTDIMHRDELVDKLFDDYRRKLAQFELAAATSAFDSAEERADAEQALATSKMRYETALRLLDECTPAKAVSIETVASIPQGIELVK